MTTKPNDQSGPAFPITWFDRDSCGEIAPRETYPGLTKRELGAFLIGCGFIANKALHFDPVDDANYILRVTDALLAELAKEDGE
jgi:hypothetical protein